MLNKIRKSASIFHGQKLISSREEIIEEFKRYSTYIDRIGIAGVHARKKGVLVIKSRIHNLSRKRTLLDFSTL